MCYMYNTYNAMLWKNIYIILKIKILFLKNKK